MARISLRVSDELKAACDAAGASELRRVLEGAFGRPGSGGLAVGLSAVSPAAAVAASEDAASIPDAAPSAQGDDGYGASVSPEDFYSPPEGVAGHGVGTGFEEAPDWAGPYGDDDVDRAVEEVGGVVQEARADVPAWKKKLEEDLARLQALRIAKRGNP